MAENGKKGWPEGFDGRFGKRFDEEVDTGFIIKVILGTAIITLGAIVIVLAIRPFLMPPAAEVGVFEPLPLEGPLLQVNPEGELAAMHDAEAAHLGARVGNTLPPAGSGWGWIDENAGIVHLPIDVAMDLYLESRGATPALASEAESATAEPGASAEVGH